MNKLMLSTLAAGLFAVLPSQAVTTMAFLTTDPPPVKPIPEPSTIVLFAAASLMLGFIGYRSRNKKD